MGFPGNEYADELAKKGTEMKLIGPKPIIPISKCVVNNDIEEYVTREWKERWQNRKDARQTAIFFPKINLKKSQEIIKLPKNSVSILVRALSGHDHRNRHNTLIESGKDEGICRLCRQEVETSSHIILECPRLLQVRIDNFKTHDADTIVRTWEVEQMASFLSVSHIAEMEQEDYSNLPE